MMTIISNFNKKEKNENEKNLNTSINLMLKNIMIKKKYNTFYLMCLMIFV